MSLSPIFDQLSCRSRVDLRCLMVCAVLVPGCAGKRLDLLMSRVDEDSSESADLAAEREDRWESAADESRTVVQTETSGPLSRLTALVQRDDDDRSESQGAGRLARLWGATGSSKSDVTSDPFVGSEKSHESTQSASEQNVPSEKSAFNRLLATITRKAPGQEPPEVDKWWEQELPATKPSESRHAHFSRPFADEFDSRLDRLRAELASNPRESVREANPFADAADDVREIARHDVRASAADNPLAGPDKPKTAVIAKTSRPEQESAVHKVVAPKLPRGDRNFEPQSESQRAAKYRIKLMMADAQRAWEGGDESRAYRVALEAQALAVLENVRFAPDERLPRELTEIVKAGLQRPSTHPLASSELPVIQERGYEADKSSLSPIDLPEFDPTPAGWDLPESTPQLAPAETQASSVASTDDARHDLLPPNDDFPSEAEMSDWNDIPNPFADPLTADGRQAASRIQLTIHQGSEVTGAPDEGLSDQLPGFTEQENQELLSSVSKQRSRVFEFDKMEWPSLPSLSVEEAEEPSDQGPIRVAQAPKFALDAQSAASATKGAIAASPAAAESGSVLGHIWRSQPLWLVGGLVLLVIALRLLPWPRDNAS